MRLRAHYVGALLWLAAPGAILGGQQAPHRSLAQDFCSTQTPGSKDWRTCNDEQLQLDGMHAVADEKLLATRIAAGFPAAREKSIDHAYDAWKAAYDAACSTKTLDQPHWYWCGAIAGRQYLSFLEWAYAPLLTDQTQPGNILDPVIAATGCLKAGLPQSLCREQGLDEAATELQNAVTTAAPPAEVGVKWEAYTAAACDNLGALNGGGRGTTFPAADRCREILTRQLAELLLIVHAK